MKCDIDDSPSEEIMEETIDKGVEVIQHNVVVEDNVEIADKDYDGVDDNIDKEDVNLEDNVVEYNDNVEDSVVEDVVDYNKSYGSLDIHDREIEVK